MLMGSLCAHLGAEVEVPGLVAAAKEERAGGGAGPLACREVEARGEGRNTTRRKIKKLKLRLGRHSGVLPLTTPWPASHPASWGPEPAGTHPPAALPGDAAERRGRVPPRCRAPPAAAAPQGWGAGAARHAPPTPAAAPRPAPGWQGVTAGGGGLGSSKRTAGPLESNAPCMPSTGHSGAARWLGQSSPALPPRAPSSHGATPQGAQPACEGCSPASQEVQTPRRRRLKGVAHSTMATASWAQRGWARSDEAMLKTRGLRRGAACSGPGGRAWKRCLADSVPKRQHRHFHRAGGWQVGACQAGRQRRTPHLQQPLQRDLRRLEVSQHLEHCAACGGLGPGHTGCMQRHTCKKWSGRVRAARRGCWSSGCCHMRQSVCGCTRGMPASCKPRWQSAHKCSVSAQTSPQCAGTAQRSPLASAAGRAARRDPHPPVGCIRAGRPAPRQWRSRPAAPPPAPRWQTGAAPAAAWRRRRQRGRTSGAAQGAPPRRLWGGHSKTGDGRGSAVQHQRQGLHLHPAPVHGFESGSAVALPGMAT